MNIAMSLRPELNQENHYLVEHIDLLRESLRHYAGRDLIDVKLTGVDAVKEIFHAPFVVLSHDTAEDPIFTYANRIALELFEMTWQEFTLLPSRQSAEAVNQQKRAQVLETVANKGFIDGYSGIRISKSGKRFLIENATLWNLIDNKGRYRGQAATFASWRYINPNHAPE